MPRQAALAGAPDVEHRAEHCREPLEQFHRQRVEAEIARALERERAHLAAGVLQRKRGDGAGAARLRKLGMREAHHQATLLRARVNHRLLLVERLGHRGDGGAEEVGAAVDLRGVGYRLDADLISYEQAEHHPVAAQARGELRDERARRVREARLVEKNREHLQAHLEAQARRLRRVGLAAQQHLEPGRAPLELAHGGLELALVARAELQPDHPPRLAVDAHRVGDHVRRARAARLDQPAAFAQRALDRLREMAALAPRLGPERERGEGFDAGLLQDHRGVDHAADHAALQLEPRLAELFGRCRAGKAPPGDVQLAALRLGELELRRSAADLSVRAQTSPRVAAAGPDCTLAARLSSWRPVLRYSACRSASRTPSPRRRGAWQGAWRHTG
jgi:hypothetical protein